MIQLPAILHQENEGKRRKQTRGKVKKDIRKINNEEKEGK
jgi:hypothetical protein